MTPTSGHLNTARNNRVICLPFTPEEHERGVNDPVFFRQFLNKQFDLHPELFPEEFAQGYRMKDIRPSKKLGVLIRRIEIGSVAYTVRPSFIMPHNTAFIEDVEKGLFLRKFSVPYWGISHTFGRDSMFWYRQEASLGRFNLVQTTVKDPKRLPDHLAADEKHTKLKGDKVYIATTVGSECILGCEVAEDAGNESLKGAYGIFKEEIFEVDKKYSPVSVNLDGWAATNNAWQSLFPAVAIISCILHVYIKLRDCSKKKWKDAFNLVADKFWECYNATTKASFSQRLRRFDEWAKYADIPEFMRKRIAKMRGNASKYSIAYDFRGSHRTSNMLDRLMQRMDRRLLATQYFHGNIRSANLAMRGWCLIVNFAPLNPTTVKKTPGLQSPAERLNGRSYHPNWLQNLLVATSLATGYRQPPPKPL
ncbi:hypothetical protein BVY04_00290 [bacterium M21]|nr:hypothetical protein BVY04_00290 [bacterium M21]